MTLARLKPTAAGATWGGAHSATLQAGLDLLRLDATGTQVARLKSYGELLLKWNRTYNLLGTNSQEALLQDHLLDSLAVIPALTRWLPPKNARLMDIGSGAGLPGLVLAIMLEQLRITLVEPNGKKAAFLRQAIAHCNLAAVDVAESRIEDLGADVDRSRRSLEGSRVPNETPHFICRAFTSLARYTALCRPLLEDASMVFAMKAARAEDEVSELETWVEVVAIEPLVAVGKDVQRNLVVMRSSDRASAQALNSARPLDGPAPGDLLGNHTDDR